MSFDSVVSPKFEECLDALEYRLTDRKNYRNAAYLLARLGGNIFSTETAYYVEEFVLHAILLGPLFFINLKIQDPPRAALQAGMLFAEKFSKKYFSVADSSESVRPIMTADFANSILAEMRSDEDLCSATTGWVLIDLIRNLERSDANLGGEVDSSPNRRFLEQSVEHGADDAAFVRQSRRFGISWCESKPRQLGTVESLIEVLSCHLLYGPFEGKHPIRYEFVFKDRTSKKDLPMTECCVQDYGY